MASLKPSGSETCSKDGRCSMRGVEVLAEIFHDSDSAKSLTHLIVRVKETHKLMKMIQRKRKCHCQN